METYRMRTAGSALRRSTAALLTAGALVLAAGSTAHAADWVHVDPAGDVAKATYSETQEDPGFTAAPEERRIDVRRVRVVHRSTQVLVKFKTREALPGRDFAIFAEIKTPDARYGVERVSLFGESDTTFTKGTRARSCRGLKVTIDRPARTATISVPRRCLESPRWVRVGLGVLRFRGETVYADDGLSARIGDGLVLSPRVRRG